MCGRTRDVAVKLVAYLRLRHAPRSPSLPGDPDLVPRRERTPGWSCGDLTFLHTGGRPPKGSLTGVQNTSKPRLPRAQPGTFQFARDREAPPNGYDVMRMLCRDLRLLLSVTPPSSHPGLESFLAEEGVRLKWSTAV